MSARSMARRYAQALFDVAVRGNRAAAVESDLSGFTELVRRSPELAAVFATPTVPARKKRALVEALFEATGEQVAPEVTRLVAMLAERDRLGMLGDVLAAYQDRVMDAARVVPAEVVTAVPLPEDRKQALAEALGRATGRQVTISDRLDPSILGGVVARVGSLVFDGSVVGQLARLRQRLSAEA